MRERRIHVAGWALGVLLAVLAPACSTSDDVSPAPLPTSPTPTAPAPPTPTPLAPGDRIQMSGRVLDENGSPIAGAIVEVEYSNGGGVSDPFSTPPSHCLFAEFCWLATRTDARGGYAVEFEARSWKPKGFPELGYGYVWASQAGYNIDVQWVPTDFTPAVRDLRLRRPRRISAGASLLLAVDPTSSLCTDLEDLYVVFTKGTRCEVISIDSGPGVLTVEAHPVGDGPSYTMFWYTTGNYAGPPTHPAPGVVVIPAKGGTYRVLVGVPEGATGQFQITTTLQ